MDDFTTWDFEIVVPASDSLVPSEVAGAPERQYVLFDEVLHFYLLLRAPSGVPSERLHGIALKHLDIQVSGSLTVTLPPQRSSSVDRDVPPTLSSSRS
ncbi:hypothetical protein HK405_005986, partial [Cladochytrium tenue]